MANDLSRNVSGGQRSSLAGSSLTVGRDEELTIGFGSLHRQLAALELRGLSTLGTSVKFWGSLSLFSNVGSLFGGRDSDEQLFTALWEYVGHVIYVICLCFYVDQLLSFCFSDLCLEFQSSSSLLND